MRRSRRQWKPATMHQGILKQTTETESSNFNANGAAGFAQLIRINEVDVMSVLSVKDKKDQPMVTDENEDLFTWNK